MIYAIAFIFMIVTIAGIAPLIKQNLKKELLVYLGIMIIASIYSFSILLDWNLPTPGKLITLLLNPISNLFFK